MYDVPEVNIVAPADVEGGWVFVARAPAERRRTVQYSVTARGDVDGDFDYFRKLVYETLNSGKGWSRAGLTFEEVESGGSFVLYLQEAAIFDTIAGCDSSLSCRSGNNVMINDERWKLATEHWVSTGLALDDYRRLVINHEVGHWLGHRHVETPCSTKDELAPLMMESSVRESCAPNIWPLEDELWHQR